MATKQNVGLTDEFKKAILNNGISSVKAKNLKFEIYSYTKPTAATLVGQVKLVVWLANGDGGVICTLFDGSVAIGSMVTLLDLDEAFTVHFNE